MDRSPRPLLRDKLGSFLNLGEVHSRLIIHSERIHRPCKTTCHQDSSHIVLWITATIDEHLVTEPCRITSWRRFHENDLDQATPLPSDDFISFLSL